MALVFQYGSNMSASRLNSEDRLAGDAKSICIAKTVGLFDFGFTVWSKSNNCAAADLIPSELGINAYGVVYEIPDFLLSRDTAKEKNRKSMDAIEGEGINYVRTAINLVKRDGAPIRAITYLVKNRKFGLKTSLAYVEHILLGLKEHDIPAQYCNYVRTKIIENNGELKSALLPIEPREN